MPSEQEAPQPPFRVPERFMKDGQGRPLVIKSQQWYPNGNVQTYLSLDGSRTAYIYRHTKGSRDLIMDVRTPDLRVRLERRDR